MPTGAAGVRCDSARDVVQRPPARVAQARGQQAGASGGSVQRGQHGLGSLRGGVAPAEVVVEPGIGAVHGVQICVREEANHRDARVGAAVEVVRGLRDRVDEQLVDFAAAPVVHDPVEVVE